MAKNTLQLGDTGLDLVNRFNNNSDELYASSVGSRISILEGDDISSDNYFSEDNTYIVSYDFDFLGKTVYLPSNITIIFNGGIWSNGNIVGNNSIFIVQDYIQCFTIDLDLTGTWKNGRITPQNYGAITNTNTGIFINDCTDILQKCIDSSFNVYIPSGFYYITNEVIIGIDDKIIRLEGKCSYEDSICSTNNHARIYTDQNINLIKFRAENIDFSGGVIDIIQAENYNKSVIFLDVDYMLGAPIIDTSIYGSFSKLKNKSQNGNGIYCNLDNASIANKGSYGATIKGDFRFLKKAINIPELYNAELANFFSIYNIYASFWGNKQDMILHSGQLANIATLHQGVKVCTVDELPLYAVSIMANNSVFDCMVVDYGMNDGTYYSPNHLVNNGINNSFINRSRLYYHLFTFNTPASVPFNSLINPNNFILNNLIASNLQNNNFISLIHNQFCSIKKTIQDSEIAMYSGDGYDFDNNLDSSSNKGLNSPLSMEIYNGSISTLLLPRGEQPFIKFVNNNTGLLTDFIEVVIPASSNWSNYLYIFGCCVSGKRFRRIQFIIKGNDENLIYNYYPQFDDIDNSIIPFSKYELKDIIPIEYIIIRFIGGYNLFTGTEISIIQEIFSKSYRNNKNSMIDINGGQIIYGNITVNDGVKEIELPVYTDNASAKSGGLVAGDPYRTSTGIRMVVYD